MNSVTPLSGVTPCTSLCLAGKDSNEAIGIEHCVRIYSVDCNSHGLKTVQIPYTIRTLAMTVDRIGTLVLVEIRKDRVKNVIERSNLFI